MTFCTAVNCIDGRVQIPVIEYLTARLGVAYVDMITEPGPVRAITDLFESELSASIFRRVQVSIDAHESGTVAVVAHADCAGNPVDDERQRSQIREAAKVLSERFPTMTVLGLWVDEAGGVEELGALAPTATTTSETWTDWEPPTR